ncbi:MAG: SLBB domain-containing protein, partial [Bacteroidales bacterium]|nr:SLBB domain-containing protein [Bacteroidales bacterium]
MKSLLKTKHSLFIVLLTVFILLFGTQMIYAQTPSSAIMSQINAELQKRGLNEAEVRIRLLQEGIDVENIPVEQLPQYQTRVTAILDEMEAEKKAAGSPEVISEGPVIAMPEIIESGTGISETSEPPTTKEEAIAEAAQRVIQAVAVEEEGPVAIYGHSLFTDQTLDVFRTTDGAFAPDSYILGAGDEIRITIFGASQTDMQLMINNEGYIQPTGMPKIFLQGLSLQQARNLLYKRLSVSYTFRSDQFALTIATARTIMVNIFGETKITGGFTLSALNSAFNALSAAGGPTDIGSVRNIQLIRGQSRKKLDLYAFMSDPVIQYQFDLQQNDIIYVPVVQNLVTLEGAVKRPMRYEMLPKETLTDLINYAGGLNVDAYPDFVQIQRYVNGEIILQEYNLSEVLSGKINVALQNGDIVRIKSIEKPIEQYVEITGSVYYPGMYDLNANPTLDSLLYNAQLTTQARTDLLFVERIRPDETVEVLTIPWTELQNSGQEFMLKARDRIQVLELASYR